MASFAVTFDDYAFTNLDTLRDNFRDAVPQTVRLPGLHGGFDTLGAEDAPSEIGRVDVTFNVEVTNRNSMQCTLDAVGKLKYYGKRKLYFQPEGTGSQRWTWARVNSINWTRGPTLTTDLWQPVSVTFQAPDPHWYTDPTSGTITASGTGTLGTVTNNGNAEALAYVSITCGTAQTALTPAVRRLVSGGTPDSMAFSGTVGNSQSLILDAQAKAVTLNGTGEYDQFSYTHPDWLRLLPGANVLRVDFGTATSAATVVVTWSDTYR